ncbi:MAG: hypothetical protein RR520_02820, partial [Erysipelotrichaceae bacterium]
MKKTMLSRIMLLVGCFLLSFSMVTPGMVTSVHATAGGQGATLLSVNPNGPVDDKEVFRTIEDAIKVANTIKDYRGIQIFVYPGTYDVKKIDATCKGVVEIKEDITITGVDEIGRPLFDKKDTTISITSSAAHNDDDSVFVASN